MNTVRIKRNRGKPKQSRGRHRMRFLKNKSLQHRFFGGRIKGFGHCQIYNILCLFNRKAIFAQDIMVHRDKGHRAR